MCYIVPMSMEHLGNFEKYLRRSSKEWTIKYKFPEFPAIFKCRVNNKTQSVLMFSPTIGIDVTNPYDKNDRSRHMRTLDCSNMKRASNDELYRFVMITNRDAYVTLWPALVSHFEDRKDPIRIMWNNLFVLCDKIYSAKLKFDDKNECLNVEKLTEQLMKEWREDPNFIALRFDATGKSYGVMVNRQNQPCVEIVQQLS